ncbi:MAG: hypothetical protein RLZZ41_658 [Actinomycetota bacterium]
MLKLLKKPQHQSLAEQAAKETAPVNGVGKFLGITSEDRETTSYRFQSNLTGYVGWEWNVIVFQGKKSDPATVSEVLLLPGKEAIVAPSWVPWSERRAEIEKNKAEELALTDLEVTEDAETDTEDAGKRPPIRKRLRKRLAKKKDKN